MKIIKIEGCKHCIHRRYASVGALMYCNKSRATIQQKSKIPGLRIDELKGGKKYPDWCELEDEYELTEEQTKKIQIAMKKATDNIQARAQEMENESVIRYNTLKG